MIGLLLLGCLSQRGALQFDGEDDYAVVNGVDGLDGDALTVEAWVRRTSPSTDRPDILARRSATGHQDSFLFRVRVDMGGVLEYGIAADGREWGTAGRRPIPVSRWTFVTVTHDRAGGQVTFYVDGELDAAQVAPFQPARGADLPMWLGGDPFRGPTGRPWAGEIAGVWLWDTVRSAAEVGADFRDAPPAGTPGLLFAWAGGAGDELRLGAADGGDPSDPVRVSLPALPPR